MEYYELRIINCDDSRDLYRCLTKIRGSIAVTDLGKSVYVYGEMTTEEFTEITRICEKFGEIDD